MSANTDKIIDMLKAISLLEASLLVKQIEQTFGVSATLTAASVNMSVSGTNTKSEEPVIEEKTEFDLIINEVPLDKRINVIRVIRAFTGLGIREAKDLIEALPKVVCEGVSKEDAEANKKLLEDAGASVVIK